MNLFYTFTRWKEFRGNNNVKTDKDVAEMVLNFYDAEKSSQELKSQSVVIVVSILLIQQNF